MNAVLVRFVRSGICPYSGILQAACEISDTFLRRLHPSSKMSDMRVTLASVLLLVLCWPPSNPAAAAAPDREIRALWVTRGEYRDAADVQRIVADAARLNFNVILFQVRGNGTVYYKSKIEPWAYELTSRDPKTTGKDPGWDPLAVAVAAAKEHGVELHAWVNVFPAWRSQQYPPQESGQLWWAHPEWFMHDAAGERMLPRDHRVNEKVKDWYSFLSPGVPEVQKYLADVCAEIVTNYAVDGLHYDYIRYPREIDEVKKEFRARAKKLGNWSYDPVSMKRFSEETGLSAPDDDADKWFEWRAAQVTATVKLIADRVRPIAGGASSGSGSGGGGGGGAGEQRKLIISAAVGADPVDSKTGKGQDYLTWMKQGTVDGVFLMGYTDDIEKFTRQCNGVIAARPVKQGFVAAGIGVRYEPKIVLEEIAITRKLGLDGFAAFSYGPLFEDEKGRPRSENADKLKEAALATKAATPW